MSAKITCPNCGWRNAAGFDGAKVRCSHCQAIFTCDPGSSEGLSQVAQRRSNPYQLSIPGGGWHTDSWYKPGFFNERIGKRITNPQKRSAKETLLRRSLELIRGKSSNGDICAEIFSKAFKAGMFGLAQEAILIYSEDTDYQLYQSCSELFEYVAVYREIDVDFVPRCEKRVLSAPPGMWEEERSRSSWLSWTVLLLWRDDRQRQRGLGCCHSPTEGR